MLPSSVDFERIRPGPKITTLHDRYGLAGKMVVMTLGRLSASESYKGRMHAGSTGFHANDQTSGGARNGTR